MRTWVAGMVVALMACGEDRAQPAPVGAAGAGGAATTNDDPCAARATPYDLETSTGTLHGTLELPMGCEPAPVVLIHAGSGPTDRDGNNPLLGGDNDSLKLLAEGLAARGIASLRYDKRGIAASAAAGPDSEHEFRFDTLVDDCAAWLVQLAADARFSRLTALGHSEGALIAMLGAAATPVDAYVSVAGPGRPANELLRMQLEAGLPPAAWAEARAILERLEAGETVDTVPAGLEDIFRPSVQPYLISWFAHDPSVEIASLGADVAIAQGTTDTQVAVEDAELLAAARPDAELLIIEGMSHVLKQATLDAASQTAAYTDASLPVMEELLELVARVARGS